MIVESILYTGHRVRGSGVVDWGTCGAKLAAVIAAAFLEDSICSRTEHPRTTVAV